MLITTTPTKQNRKVKHCYDIFEEQSELIHIFRSSENQKFAVPVQGHMHQQHVNRFAHFSYELSVAAKNRTGTETVRPFSITCGISNFAGAFNKTNFPDLLMTAAIFQIRRSWYSEHFLFVQRILNLKVCQWACLRGELRNELFCWYDDFC